MGTQLEGRVEKDEGEVVRQALVVKGGVNRYRGNVAIGMSQGLDRGLGVPLAAADSQVGRVDVPVISLDAFSCRCVRSESGHPRTNVRTRGGG